MGEIRNRILCDKICNVSMKLNREIYDLYAQIRYLQASHPVGEKAGERDNYLSDNNVSLFTCSDDDGSI